MLPALHKMTSEPMKRGEWSMVLNNMYMSNAKNPSDKFGLLEYAFFPSNEGDKTPIQRLSTSWVHMDVQEKLVALSIVLVDLQDGYLREWGTIGSNIMGTEITNEPDLNKTVNEVDYYKMLIGMTPDTTDVSTWKKDGWDRFNTLKHHLILQKSHLGHGNKPHVIIVRGDRKSAPPPKAKGDVVLPGGKWGKKTSKQ